MQKYQKFTPKLKTLGFLTTLKNLTIGLSGKKIVLCAE